MINGELVVDNFAGGGGAGTGIEMVTGISVDIAINHDPEAVCPPIPAALVRANLPELCIAQRTGNMRIGEEQSGQLRFA